MKFHFYRLVKKQNKKTNKTPKRPFLMAVYRMRPTTSWTCKTNTKMNSLGTLVSSCQWPFASLIPDPHMILTPSLSISSCLRESSGQRLLQQEAVWEIFHMVFSVLLRSNTSEFSSVFSDSSGDQQLRTKHRWHGSFVLKEFIDLKITFIFFLWTWDRTQDFVYANARHWASSYRTFASNFIPLKIFILKMLEPHWLWHLLVHLTNSYITGVFNLVVCFAQQEGRHTVVAHSLLCGEVIFIAHMVGILMERRREDDGWTLILRGVKGEKF